MMESNRYGLNTRKIPRRNTKHNLSNPQDYGERPLASVRGDWRGAGRGAIRRRSHDNSEETSRSKSGLARVGKYGERTYVGDRAR